MVIKHVAEMEDGNIEVTWVLSLEEYRELLVAAEDEIKKNEESADEKP
jgi:hypothetical protein